jgi:hypothetical protein
MGGAMMGHDMADTCPMAVEGTAARAEDVQGGAALSFTTTGDVEGGARLILTPRDPADLPELRQHAREHAEKMASGQCPMLAMHGEGDAVAPR